MSLGLYLHIPFCAHRCAYCDFNTYAGLESLIPAYGEALCREISLVAEAWRARPEPDPLQIDTVFFGGGTPSLLPVQLTGRILESIDREFRLEPGAEITMEANPGTVTRAGLSELRRAGINRLSIGAQSADPSILQLLERTHGFDEVEQAVRDARAVGFENINLDLILGVMTQSMDSWRASLDTALGLVPEHLSLYMLSVEEGTPLAARVSSGALPRPDADLAADMYEATCELLDAAGYLHYEISNWARRETARVPGSDPTDRACRHNLHYWRNEAYLGLGAGAHGSMAGWRYANVLAPQAFIQRLALADADRFPFTPATASRHPVDRETEMRETLLMGLRLLDEGVPDAAFRARFGVSAQDAFPEAITQAAAAGLLEVGPHALRLTRRGWLLSNQVFVELV